MKYTERNCPVCGAKCSMVAMDHRKLKYEVICTGVCTGKCNYSTTWYDTESEADSAHNLRWNTTKNVILRDCDAGDLNTELLKRIKLGDTI
jgi:C4-type Zn-finger protein